MSNQTQTTKVADATQSAFTKRDIGIIVDESSGSADDLNERTISFAVEHGFVCNLDLDNEDEEDEGERSQLLSEAADDAVSFLNELDLPSYCSFYFEDNSLFLAPCIENVKEDVGFVSIKSFAEARRMGIETDEEDSDYPPADYRGEWLHVNDHGSATLYVRNDDGQDVELWSVG